MSFHPTAASAQSAGYRACKRCLPDATPGSPEWDVAADVAGRAMRLIADGLVDREGVGGLAERVGYTPRHLGRLLSQELGAAPLALARARRAQTARVLIETTDLPLTDVAFAAGFASVRQFNETVREVYDASPSQLRGRGRSRAAATARPSGAVTMRLAVRTPFAGTRLLDFLAFHVVPGVEVAGPGSYARTLDLPHGPGTVRLHLEDLPAGGGTGFVAAEFWLQDLRDTAAASERVRRLLDADCDPTAVDAQLGVDPLLGHSCGHARPAGAGPGRRRRDRGPHRHRPAGQCRRSADRRRSARRGARPARGLAGGGADPLFPDAATLAALEPEVLPMPRARGRALIALATALADGSVVLDRGPDRDDVRRALLALPGIGPWTADYVAMRALGHPDVFLPTDLAIRRVLTDLGGSVDTDPERWRPWRSYALMHLWNTLMPDTPARARPVNQGELTCGP